MLWAVGQFPTCHTSYGYYYNMEFDGTRIQECYHVDQVFCRETSDQVEASKFFSHNNASGTCILLSQVTSVVSSHDGIAGSSINNSYICFREVDNEIIGFIISICPFEPESVYPFKCKL